MHDHHPEHISEDPLFQRLLTDLLADRRAQRRRSYLRMAFIAVVGVLALVPLVMGALRGAPTSAEEGGYAALVSVRGEIGADQAASAANLSDTLERAFADEQSKVVVLVINSPGGTPVQASLIHERIVRLKKQHPTKKVVAVGEDLVASGAYMIAVAADEIVVNPSTLVGSIGVVTRGFGFTGLMDKLGIERRVATAGENKNLLDPFSPVTEQDRAKQAEILADVHEHFIALVRESRGGRLHAADEVLFTGEVWAGRRAVELGLADRVGSLAQVLDEVGVQKTREYRGASSFLQELLKGTRVEVRPVLPVPGVSALGVL